MVIANVNVVQIMNTYKRRQPAYTPPENVGVIVASACGNKEKYGVMQLVDLESVISDRFGVLSYPLQVLTFLLLALIHQRVAIG